MRGAAGGRLCKETRCHCLRDCDIMGELHYIHCCSEAFLAAMWCKRPEKLRNN
jgi:hypothetical protein